VLLALPHGVQVPDPSAGAYVPAAHGSQAVAASMPPVLEPAAQATHASSSWKRPGGHVRQTVREGSGTLPLAHRMQATAASNASADALALATSTLVSEPTEGLVKGRMCRAGQSVHAACPVRVWNWPTGQMVQPGLCAAAAKEPRGHGRQADCVPGGA
jgi:hypothetical protein